MREARGTTGRFGTGAMKVRRCVLGIVCFETALKERLTVFEAIACDLVVLEDWESDAKAGGNLRRPSFSCKQR